MFTFNPLTGAFDDKGTPFNPAVPGAIGGTTPAAGSFTTLSNTGLHTTTIGAVNTGVWTSSGYSLTGSNATTMVNLAGTWNTSGVATGINLAITDTASGNASNLFNFQYTNGSTNFVRFQRLTSTTNMFAIGGTGSSLRVFEAAESNPRSCLDSSGLRLGSNIFVRWTSSSSNALGTIDVGIFRNAAGVLEIDDGTNAAAYRDLKLRKLLVDATMTAAGTTGAQTINKGAGSVNFAAGATSLVVTNSLVTTASIVLAMVDAGSAVHVQRVVTAAGSFTINLNTTAGAEVAVKWVVLN